MLIAHRNRGALEIVNDTSSIYKVIVSDFEGNQTELNIPIRGVYKNLLIPGRPLCMMGKLLIHVPIHVFEI